MNQLKIAELAPLWKTVPPKQYGGTELVVANLTTALTRLGSEVTVFACGGSDVKGKLIPVIEKPMYDLLGGFNWSGIMAYDFLALDELIRHRDEFDVIHNHMGFHPLILAKLIDKPIVTTLHSSAAPDFPYLSERFKENNYVSISNSQRELIPYLNYVETIYHGIDTNAFIPNYAPNDYLLFIGSLTHNKGIDDAVKAAKELNCKLIIAGEIREEDRAWLDKEVFPYIDGQNIKFIGEVTSQEKAKLYANAKALVLPVRWSEAFGLVMVEAMACGTPVIAYNRGSVPEIITHGQTGFIADNFEELKQYIGQISELSREKCRHEAETKFDLMQMGEKYLKLFKRLSHI